MDCKKSIIVVGGFMIAVASLLAASPAIHASAVYKIAMKRSHPDKPLTRDEILSAVEKRYKGRIMSLQAKPSGAAQDCHVARMMGAEDPHVGEHMTIHVACD
jgi:hypothetical protein